MPNMCIRLAMPPVLSSLLSGSVRPWRRINADLTGSGVGTLNVTWQSSCGNSGGLLSVCASLFFMIVCWKNTGKSRLWNPSIVNLNDWYTMSKATNNCFPNDVDQLPGQWGLDESCLGAAWASRGWKSCGRHWARTLNFRFVFPQKMAVLVSAVTYQVTSCAPGNSNPPSFKYS